MLKKMDYFCFLTILSTVCMSQFYFYLSTNVINSKYLLLPLQYLFSDRIGNQTKFILLSVSLNRSFPLIV